MPRERIPAGVWGRRATLLALAAIGVPQVYILALARPQSVDSAVWVSALISYSVLLVSATLIYFHWRLRPSRGAAWLVMGLMLVAVQGLADSGIVFSDRSLEASTWILVVQLALAVALVCVALAASRFALAGDPAVIGIGSGVVVAILTYALVSAAQPVTPPTPVTSGLAILLLLLQVAIIGIILRVPESPFWVRARLALALTLICLGAAAVNSPREGVGVALLVVLTNVAGAVILLGTAVALLRLSIGENGEELTVLHDRLEEVEANVRVEKARMHEIGATIAGIASASRLVRQDAGITRDRRVLLEHMLQAEMGRLERLVRHDEPQAPTRIAIDDVIGPLVVAHEAREREVRWTPSGSFAVARPDDLSEVINILLENAAQHAPHGPVDIDVSTDDDRIEIVVSDSGPGIPADMRSRLFEWGVRGRFSSGRGIGLNIAQRLMAEQAGDLRIRDTRHHGASFVVELRGEGDDGHHNR